MRLAPPGAYAFPDNGLTSQARLITSGFYKPLSLDSGSVTIFYAFARYLEKDNELPVI